MATKQSNNRTKAGSSGLIQRTKLISYPAPASDASADVPAAETTDLACIYEALPIMSKLLKKWSMEVEWHGEEHIQQGYKLKRNLYDESIIVLLGMKIYALFIYLNRIHPEKPSFSTWWMSQCTPSPYSLCLNEFVYVENTRKYVHIRDVIPPSQCYIYPGYEDIAIASGFEVNLARSQHEVSYKNNKIIYIANNDSLVVFNCLPAMHFGSIKCDNRAFFINILILATEKKIRIGKEPFSVSSSYPMDVGVFDKYLEETLTAGFVDVIPTDCVFRWKTSNEVASRVFRCGALSKQDEFHKYYMEQIIFRLQRKFPSKITIEAVMLKKDLNTGGIDGKHLLYEEYKFNNMTVCCGANIIPFLEESERNWFTLLSKKANKMRVLSKRTIEKHM